MVLEAGLKGNFIEKVATSLLGTRRLGQQNANAHIYLFICYFHLQLRLRSFWAQQEARKF